MKLGEMQALKLVRFKDFGAYLGEDGGKDTVLLPKKDVPEGAQVGDMVRVFLYKDSEDRLISTTREPKVTLLLRR